MPHFVYRLGNRFDIVTADTIFPHALDTRQAAQAYKEQLERHYALPPSRKPTKRVKCWQTGDIYPSAAAAAKAFGVSRSAMSQHLKDPAQYPYIRNCTFSRID